MRHAIWNDQAELLNQPLAAALMDLRREDGDNDLLMDAVQMWEVTEYADKLLAIDGILTPYNRLEKVATQIESVMKRASGEIKPVSHVVSDPFIQLGVLQVAVVFTLSDGQTVTVYFHNPDTTPKKIQATDELISWKWLLNKKDVTILVAPEQGKELDAREVAKRVMKAAEKNSKAFIRNNVKSAERKQSLDVLTTEIAGLESECKDLEKQIELARIAAETAASVPVAPESAPALEPELVTITGTELGEFPDTPEGKKALRAAAKSHLMAMRGEWVECPALNAAVELRKIGIEKFISLSGDPRKLKLATAIKQLIRSGRTVGSGASYAPSIEQNIKAYHYLRTETLLEGNSIAVRVVVREDQQGAYHYDMTVHGIDETLIGAQEKSPTGVGLDSATTSNAGGVADESVKPSQLASCQLDSSLDHGKEYVNLFIEGEEAEAVGVFDSDWRTIADAFGADKPQYVGTLVYENYESVENIATQNAGNWAFVKQDADNRYYWAVFSLGDGYHYSGGDRHETPDMAYSSMLKSKFYRALGLNDPLPYQFANATDDFKAWVANSVNETSRSPFATAKAMDEAAIRNGASIEWGAFGGATFDSVFIDDDGEEWYEDDFYNASDDDNNENGSDLFDSSENWKKQPRNRKTGRWELRRGKRIKDAAKGALHALGRAASRANSYVSQALAQRGSQPAHSSSEALAAVGHSGAELDPGAAAIGELLGSIRSVTRVLDSVTLDATNYTEGYIGKVIKDGELVGRVDIKDNGSALVFVGTSGFNHVKNPNGFSAEYTSEPDEAAQLIDWLFAGLNGENGATELNSLNAQDFVPAPTGNVDYGSLTSEVSTEIMRQAGAIRLQVGTHDAKTGKGYGKTHILEGHKDDISRAGFASAEDFVAYVASGYNEITKAKLGRLRLIRSNGSDKGLVVELQPSDAGDFWSVVTAFPARKGQNGDLLWSAAQSHSIGPGGQPVFAHNPVTESVPDAPNAEQKSSANSSLAQPPANDKPSPLIPDGAENTVKTAKGREVKTGFTVIEADELITSHDSNGDANPLYPAELQPRDRGRDASIAWVRKTANSLDPDSLGKTRRADTGAPIVGNDRVVESGNGRTMAIKEAYRTGKAEDYRQWCIEEAPTFKLNPDKVKAMKAPVLVRVRTSELDRREFAIEANQDDKLSMTGTEKARADADRIDEALLSKLSDDGDFLAATNRDFILGFLASLGDAEAAQYMTTNGQPTGALIARVQSAVFAKAYSDDRLLELAADASKPEVANVISALNASASIFIRAKAADQFGTEALTTQVASSIEVSLNAQTIQAIIDATNLVRKAKAEGTSVDEIVSQRGLFGDIPPATAAMAVFINKNNRSPKRLGVAFKAMAQYVLKEAEAGHNVDMFGDSLPKAGLEEIIKAANADLDKEFGEGAFAIEPMDLFTAPKPTAAAPPVANNGDEEMSFLQSVVTGNVDFYDKAVTDRLESLAKTVSDPEMTALIKQAKKVVKVFFNAEFKKKEK